MSILAATICSGLSWPYAVVLSVLSAGGCGFLAFCVWITHKKDGK